MPEDQVIVVGIVQRRDLRHAHEAIQSPKPGAGVATFVREIPGASPEATSQWDLGAVPAMKPHRGLHGHRIEGLVAVE